MNSMVCLKGTRFGQVSSERMTADSNDGHLHGVGEASKYCTSLAAGFSAFAAIVPSELLDVEVDDAGGSLAVCGDTEVLSANCAKKLS